MCKLAYRVTTSTNVQWSFLLQLFQMVLSHGCHLSTAADIHIVRDSGFLGDLRTFVRSTCGRQKLSIEPWSVGLWKLTKTDLAMKQCTLCIFSSATRGAQILSNDLKEKLEIVNVQIYFEQQIERLKEF